MLHQVRLLLKSLYSLDRAIRRPPEHRLQTAQSLKFLPPGIHTLTSLLLPVTPSMARLQQRGFQVRCVEPVATGGPGYRVCLH